MCAAEQPVILTVDGRKVTITHPSRVLWPEDGLAKMDLVKYYVRIAPFILPHVADRPLTLKPYPRGIHGPSFYMHSVPKGAPPWVKSFSFVPKTEPEKVIRPVLANDAATLAWLANFTAIEIHPWLSKVDKPESPDLVVFDLDPGERVPFSLVLEVALQLRRRLEQTGLQGWAKTSGATGVHVYVPIERRHTFEQTRAFAERVARSLADEDPARITATLADPQLASKVMVDYAQNSIGKTMAAVYSVRPRPHAPVSTPLTWEEVAAGGFSPSDFNLGTIFPRVERLGDLFRPVAELAQRLPEGMLQADGEPQ